MRRILELGPGNGGFHYRNRPAGVEYFALDVGFNPLRIISNTFPGVHVIQGTAEKIPVFNGAFNQVEIRFPFVDVLESGVLAPGLLVPGLQRDFQPSGIRQFMRLLEPLSKSNKTWYGEFARVLEPNGKLLIWGDSVVDFGDVRRCSSPYFLFDSQRELSIREIEEMGTYMSLEKIERWRRGEVDEREMPVLATFTRR